VNTPTLTVRQSSIFLHITQQLTHLLVDHLHGTTARHLSFRVATQEADTQLIYTGRALKVLPLKVHGLIGAYQFHQRMTCLTAPDISPKRDSTRTFTFRHSPQVNVQVPPEYSDHSSTAGSGYAPSDFRIQGTRLVSLHQPRTYTFGGSNRMVDLLSTLVIVHRCCLLRLQALLTLSHKYFSLFNRSTCALSVPYQYSGL